jgi:hypothetical protein
MGLSLPTRIFLSSRSLRVATASACSGPGSRVRSEPATAERDAGCPPTSSWWALETLLTLARQSSGRRPSGGARRRLRYDRGSYCSRRHRCFLTPTLYVQVGSREGLLYKRRTSLTWPRRGCMGLHRRGEPFFHLCGRGTRLCYGVVRELRRHRVLRPRPGMTRSLQTTDQKHVQTCGDAAAELH